jgi:hypothetical protein
MRPERDALAVGPSGSLASKLAGEPALDSLGSRDYNGGSELPEETSMDRYAYYLIVCHREHHMPMDPGQFRATYEYQFNGYLQKGAVEYGQAAGDYARYTGKCLRRLRCPVSLRRFAADVGLIFRASHDYYEEYADRYLEDSPDLSPAQRKKYRDQWVRHWVADRVIDELCAPVSSSPYLRYMYDRYQDDNEGTERHRGDNPPPAGGSGVREPLRPHSPLLSGSAARAYPPAEPPRWWAV